MLVGCKFRQLVSLTTNNLFASSELMSESLGEPTIIYGEDFGIKGNRGAHLIMMKWSNKRYLHQIPDMSIGSSDVLAFTDPGLLKLILCIFWGTQCSVSFVGKVLLVPLRITVDSFSISSFATSTREQKY